VNGDVLVHPTCRDVCSTLAHDDEAVLHPTPRLTVPAHARLTDRLQVRFVKEADAYPLHAMLRKLAPTQPKSCASLLRPVA
jgi:hypothetical protein